jgi:hypothetical protein
MLMFELVVVPYNRPPFTGEIRYICSTWPYEPKPIVWNGERWIDPDGQETSSYPFLRLAQRLGVPYGKVLSYVDGIGHVKCGGGDFDDVWQSRSVLDWIGTEIGRSIEATMTECHHRWRGIHCGG